MIKNVKEEVTLKQKTVKDFPIIPRTSLFGNPDKMAPLISYDGSMVAFLAPVDGVMNICVGPSNDIAKAKPVSKEKTRPIRVYFWGYNGNIIYLQDEGGNEDFHVFAIDLKSGKTKALTPIKGARALVVGVSHKFPNEIAIGLNDRDPRYFDVHKLDLTSGERKLVFKNDEFDSFILDDNYNVRFVTRITEDGGSIVFKIKPDGTREEYDKISLDDSSNSFYIGVDRTGKILTVMDSRDRDTSAIFEVDIDSGNKKLLAQDAKSDADEFIISPITDRIQAVAFNYERKHWVVVDKEIKSDLEFLKTVRDGDFMISSQTKNGKQWIVVYVLDDGPVSYYLYDREIKKATFLFTSRKALEKVSLSKMHPVVVKARDGLDLVCYITLPPWSDGNGDGVPDKPLPMVLNVHGGPWARDEWGYNPEAQLYSNRGYAVMSVNYRGSTGFGKSFVKASFGEWAGKMHDDLIDAIKWAAKKGIADPDKIAIYGGSYGGYATLVGLTFTPKKFACGVDIVGPSNIATLLSTIPAYWAPALNRMIKWIGGDHRTDKGNKYLFSRSPLSKVNKISKPLLIGQGANDPRVKQTESDQIVKEMKEKGLPVTYVLYPDEGHGFARPENKRSFYAIAEIFLAKFLGGRFEPITEDDVKGSSVTAPEGAKLIKGLSSLIKKPSSLIKKK